MFDISNLEPPSTFWCYQQRASSLYLPQAASRFLGWNVAAGGTVSDAPWPRSLVVDLNTNR